MYDCGQCSKWGTRLGGRYPPRRYGDPPLGSEEQRELCKRHGGARASTGPWGGLDESPDRRHLLRSLPHFVPPIIESRASGKAGLGRPCTIYNPKELAPGQSPHAQDK